MEEAAFIDRLKLGDKSAFAEVVHAYSSMVLTTCYKFLLDKQDAEDLSQEVFIEVYQSIKTFRGDSKLSTWIYRISVTKCLDEIKKRQRKKRFIAVGKLLHLDDIMHWVSGGKEADKLIEEKESRKEIMKALNALPENQRVAFTLSKIEGYSNTEIAVIMNTTIEAVESLIYRAKKCLNDELRTILELA